MNPRALTTPARQQAVRIVYLRARLCGPTYGPEAASSDYSVALAHDEAWRLEWLDKLKGAMRELGKPLGELFDVMGDLAGTMETRAADEAA